MMALSFYMSHPVATGVGGMLLTNDEADASVARSLMNHGRIDDGSHFQFGRLGSSSRVTELEAAIGVGALERYDENLARRRDIALWYDKALESANVERVNRERHGTHGFMFYPIRVPWGREELMGVLRRAGMESREAMPLINQPVYRETYEKGPRCPNAEIWTKNGLLLPLHPQMTADDVGRVGETVERFYK
jgi:dTDP-4-amino-4,6-dideoxygalactose transaminase